MLRLHCLLLIVHYEEAQLSVASGLGSSNFFYYFRPVFALFLLPLPTLVYFSPKNYFFLPRALLNMDFYSLKKHLEMVV